MGKGQNNINLYFILYHSNLYDFAYNRQCLLGTLKGILSCFKSQKLVLVCRAKKRGRLFLAGLQALNQYCHVLKRHWAWTYTPPGVASSELMGGIPLLTSGGRRLMNRKNYCVEYGLNKLHVGKVVEAAGGLWVHERTVAWWISWH